MRCVMDCTDGWTDGRMDGRTDGWTEVRTDVQTKLKIEHASVEFAHARPMSNSPNSSFPVYTCIRKEGN